jgi:hypothetical protein
MPNDNIKSAKDFTDLIRRVRGLADSVRGKDNDEIDFAALRDEWRKGDAKKPGKKVKRKSRKKNRK